MTVEVNLMCLCELVSFRISPNRSHDFASFHWKMLINLNAMTNWLVDRSFLMLSNRDFIFLSLIRWPPIVLSMSYRLRDSGKAKARDSRHSNRTKQNFAPLFIRFHTFVVGISQMRRKSQVLTSFIYKHRIWNSWRICFAVFSQMMHDLDFIAQNANSFFFFFMFM